jgi:hypothetical protein
MNRTPLGLTLGLVLAIAAGARPVWAGTPAMFPQQTANSGCQVQNAEPDPTCTPGAVFDVGTAQICIPGYATSVRDVLDSERRAVYAEYGLAPQPGGTYEVDHLIPLELGGSNDIANLWPEAATPTPGYHQKDALENSLHTQVCAGTVALADAQTAMATDWLSAWSAAGLSSGGNTFTVLPNPAPMPISGPVLTSSAGASQPASSS